MEQQVRDAIVGGTWLTLSAYSLVANLLLLFLICNSGELRKFTSYWIIASFSLCDAGMTIISLCHFIPSILARSGNSRPEAVLDYFMLFYNLFWYTEIVHIALMAFNRFICIVYPVYHTAFFSAARTSLLLCLSYVLGFAITLPTLFPKCYLLWNSQYYIPMYAVEDTWYRYMDLGVNATVVALTVAFYGGILYEVRNVARKSQQSAFGTGNINQRNYRMEIRLLAQFFATSLVYVLTWTCWLWMPNITFSQWIGFSMTSLFFINTSVNPTIYLIFNKSLRQKFYHVVCRKSKDATTPFMTVKTNEERES
ncbi:unnamed protein product [Cylicocyclus nassatus]|uniref:G-protein coupled receptors family 1 profile domain-containing protein n=1 Tax=Cylicocyclus nassatus TaxID=53992 RepID=A0AA36GRE3_CYLNA|nr:unnamed protein product [Cylicocyclus nassatus]